jgi:hypothetical protein
MARWLAPHQDAPEVGDGPAGRPLAEAAIQKLTVSSHFLTVVTQSSINLSIAKSNEVHSAGFLMESGAVYDGLDSLETPEMFPRVLKRPHG